MGVDPHNPEFRFEAECIGIDVQRGTVPVYTFLIHGTVDMRTVADGGKDAMAQEAHYPGDRCPPDGHAAEAKLAEEAGFPVKRKPVVGGTPIPVTDLAAIIGTVVADPALQKETEWNALLETFARQLDASQLAPSIVRARAMKKALDRIITIWEQRYGEELGGVDYYDEHDEQHVFTSSSSRQVCTDPVALVMEMMRAGASLVSILGAVTSTGFRKTDLEAIADGARDEETKAALHGIIREYYKRSYGPKHLTLRD